MKPIIAFLLVFVIMGCSNSSSDEVVIFETAESIEQESAVVLDNAEESKPLIHIGSEDTLQIMVRADGAPGMYADDDGEVHGFYVDLERLVMEEMGQTYEFVAYTDLGPVIQGVKEGSMHVAIATPDLPDYRSMLNVSIPYERLNFVIFVKAENDEINGDSKDKLIQSLFGKTVGVQTQGHIYQVLREYKEITLLEYPTTTQALADLEKGTLDAVPDVKRIGYYYAKMESWDIRSVGEPIISQNICTGFSKMLAPDILERYNKALTAVLEDGRYENLYNSYFGLLDESSKPVK